MGLDVQQTQKENSQKKVSAKTLMLCRQKLLFIILFYSILPSRFLFYFSSEVRITELYFSA